ncbi:hypothetical protein E1B28_000734 [Marasmius oreades]|uniref:Mmc1 C-terminal domain-containing protein n=1 Tax=Marasmius oreades TaxID=181124 RepID=A0A9P7V1X5_9AGAR|nr:uncharacterized protein E1B28_000734 [Marasmius oreades]KAG7098830.1 hypothetical protein E1B28_000734 [Marasmius oreades]
MSKLPSTVKLVFYGSRCLTEKIVNVVLDAPFKTTAISPFYSEFPLDVTVQQEYSYQPPLDADIAICVVDPVSGSPAPTVYNPNTILVYTSIPTTSYRPPPHIRTKKVLFIDPGRARAGLDAIRADPSSSAAVQIYRHDFLGSRAGDILRTLKQYFAESPTIQAIRKRKQLGQLVVAETEVNNLLDKVCDLRASVEEEKEKVIKEILGGGRVRHAVAQAKNDITPSMDRLTWWRMIWRVDEISNYVQEAVGRAWCRGLEEHLTFYSGKLTDLQERLECQASSLLPSQGPPFSPTSNAVPTPPFNVIRNLLQQQSRLPSYGLHPGSMTSPLRIRLSQLAAPTTELHLTGQRATLGMSASVASAVGFTWAAWLATITTFHLPLLGTIESTTALGLGLLSLTVGVRITQSHVEKAKKRWWADFDRVSEGLDRDVRKAVETVLDEKVFVVARKACTEIDKWGKEAKEAIEKSKDALETDSHREESKRTALE